MRLRANAPLRHVDLALAGASAAIAGIGVLMVYTATRTNLDLTGREPETFLVRQALWGGIGLAAMVAVMAVDYRRLRDGAPGLYVAAVAALILVMSPVGSSARGAQRWFNVGSLQFQPSAVTSLALIVAVAAYCQHRRDALDGRGVWVAVALGTLPMALVAVQPDLGSAIVFGAVLLAMLVVAGTRAQHMAALVLLAVTAVVAVAHLGLLKPYQSSRLTAFLDQSNDRDGTNYNLRQSQIAIAAGGLTGKGLFHGSQTNLSFVPEQQTDFIFTAVGEQLGFAGGLTLFGLFAIVIWRTWRAACLARDRFGTLVCAGVLALITIQLFENAGMTMGIMPITGIPLPLVSYGGSSTIVTFAALGLVNSVRMRRFS